MKKYLISRAVGNNEYRFRYEFNKNNSFIKPFIKFMKDLGFEEEDIKEHFTDYDQEEKPIEVVNIKKWKDLITNFRNKEFDIDLFYGEKILIVLIRTKDKDKLFKIADMPKPKKFKPIEK